MTCSSPAADAAIACMATPVLQAADTEIAAQRLQWLTTSMRRRGFSLVEPRNLLESGEQPLARRPKARSAFPDPFRQRFANRPGTHRLDRDSDATSHRSTLPIGCVRHP